MKMCLMISISMRWVLSRPMRSDLLLLSTTREIAKAGGSFMTPFQGGMSLTQTEQQKILPYGQEQKFLASVGILQLKMSLQLRGPGPFRSHFPQRIFQQHL